jgi:hypothetical protein
MRLASRFRALVIVAVMGSTFGMGSAIAASPLNPFSPCSVFDSVPCTPSFCSVFDPWPCVPTLPSIGDGLRITVAERAAAGARSPRGRINSLQELRWALSACWEPPPLNEAFQGMEMSVRFSFRRNGELIAPPRVTYTHNDAGPEIKRAYRQAIDDAIARCTPMPFSEKMGAAIAGRPISIRFIDNRRRGAD